MHDAKCTGCWLIKESSNASLQLLRTYFHIRFPYIHCKWRKFLHSSFQTHKLSRFMRTCFLISPHILLVSGFKKERNLSRFYFVELVVAASPLFLLCWYLYSLPMCLVVSLSLPYISSVRAYLRHANPSIIVTKSEFNIKLVMQMNYRLQHISWQPTNATWITMMFPYLAWFG
jgi:hypothetical protein